jgi:hypothetical protein
MKVHHSVARRLVVVTGAVLSATLAFANPASAACYSRNDDGSMERALDLDFNDDSASATLNSGVIVDASGTGTATLSVYGQAYGCNGTNGNALLVNGTLAASFDACTIWPTSYYWYGSLTFRAALLHAGANTFQIIDTSTSWSDGVLLGVDSNSFTGRSSMTQNGTPVTGELMWELYTPGLVCL